MFGFGKRTKARKKTEPKPRRQSSRARRAKKKAAASRKASSSTKAEARNQVTFTFTPAQFEKLFEDGSGVVKSSLAPGPLPVVIDADPKDGSRWIKIRVWD